MEHHLALAEGHVSKGMDILVAQRALMSRLEHEGRDTREASALYWRVLRDDGHTDFR